MSENTANAKRGRGRPGVYDHLRSHYGKSDFLPTFTADVEGLTTAKAICDKIEEMTGKTVNPIYLRKMVRKPANLRRVRKSSTLYRVVEQGRGRPRNVVVSEPEVATKPEVAAVAVTE